MSSQELPIIERPEVHKSAKSLELIVALFHDYCQAVGAIASIQKRLSKALKEASLLKGTHATPANAMAASSAIFDSLAEVDLKFSKVCEKEYEAMSAELKKWFKKMAKEEKNHDDLTFNTNTRIKQASQAYDKKARGKPREVNEEHIRYVNLLTSLGNDLAQAKLTHSTFITQRHTLTIFSVGGTMARLADAEWVRACEQVRRCSGGVGKVGQWRMFCEGGWQYPIPGDLVDIDKQDNPFFSPATSATLQVLSPSIDNVSTPNLSQDVSPLYSPLHSHSPKLPSRVLPNPPALSPSNGVITLPHVATNSISSSGTPSTSVVLPPPSPLTNFSPTVKFADEVTKTSPKSTPSTSALSHGELLFTKNIVANSGESVEETRGDIEASAVDRTPRKLPDRSPRSLEDEHSLLPTPAASELSRGTGPSQSQSSQELSGYTPETTGSDINDNTVGDEKPRNSTRPQMTGTYPSDRPTRNAGRSMSIDSTLSVGSHVAALRERYAERANNPTSPPPRDLPRLQQSVNNLVQKYVPGETPAGRVAPPSSFNSSVVDRYNSTDRDRYATRRTSFESERERDRDRDRDSYRERERERLLSTPRRSREWAESGDISDDKDRERIRRRRQEEWEWDEREQELRDRERRLERQQKDLNREKEKFLGPRGRISGSDERPQFPQIENERPSRLPPPSHAIRSDRSGHASNCGCYECSAKHYATTSPPPSVSDHSRLGNEAYSSSTTSLSKHPATQPHIRPQQTHSISHNAVSSINTEKEKKGTWMGKNLRRLSMPIGAAFASDSSRSSPATLIPPILEDTRTNTYDGRRGNSLGVAALRR